MMMMMASSHSLASNSIHSLISPITGGSQRRKFVLSFGGGESSAVAATTAAATTTSRSDSSSKSKNTNSTGIIANFGAPPLTTDDSSDNDNGDGGVQQHKIELLFFNGINDLICNHVGNENALENLQWNHLMEYQTSKRYGWKSQSIDKLGGYMKGYQNLSFLKILNSGHMVPMDVPDVALDMLQTFIYKQSFETYNQNIDVIAMAAAATTTTTGNGGTTPCPQCPQQGNCPDNNNNINVDCSFCEDDDAEFCTKRDCESKYDFSSSSSSTSTLPTISSSPIVSGAVIGVAVFSSLLGMGCFVYYCLCRRRNNGNTKYGSVNVELSNGGGGGKMNGYSDDENGRDSSEDDIEIDDEFDSGIRQRGQLA